MSFQSLLFGSNVVGVSERVALLGLLQCFVVVTIVCFPRCILDLKCSFIPQLWALVALMNRL